MTSAGVVPTPAVAYLTRTRGLRRRRRHLGVAQSVRGQRHQGVLGTRREVHRTRRARGRGDRRRPVVDRRERARRRRCRGADLVGAYLDHLRAVFPETPPLEGFSARHRLRERRDDDRWRRGCSQASGFDTVVIGNQPDGRNINLDCGSTHPERLARTVVERRLPDGRGVRRRRRPRDLRRSSPAGSSNGDAVLLMCGRQLQREGRLQGRRDRRDRDEQHRSRARAARDRHRARALRCRRQVRDGGDAEARRCRSAASSPATSSSPTTCSPATGCARRSTCCGRSR